MKLLRIGEAGNETPAVLIDGHAYDLSQITSDFDGAFFAGNGIDRLRRRLAEGVDGLPELDPDTRVGAPIARPGQVWCIGVNYRDHAAESSIPVPDEPIVFGKAAFSVIGPDDDVHIPRGSVKTDWEVELGVVIGRPARYLESDVEALECIAGVVISHDVSEREWQLEHAGDWIKGKSFETFNPLGPWLVTLDEIGDLTTLRLELDVNGEAEQRGSTAEMVFGVAQLVRYLSQFTVLQPGDLVNTGTPAGVGLGQKPPRYLVDGDVVDLRIPGLGAQRQRFVAAP